MGFGRAAVALNVWFKSAALGVDKYEILARSSAMCVRRPQAAKVQLLSCLHVVQPFRYPQYYPPEVDAVGWVHALTESDIKCTVHVADEEGAALGEVELEKSIPHHTRDLVSMRFKDEQAGQALLKKFQVRVFGEQWDIASEVSTQVQLDGHRVALELVDGEDESTSIPFSESGQIVHKEWSRGRGQQGNVFEDIHIFAATSSILSQGMCGGPVVRASEPDVLVGMVEGILTKEQAEASGINHQLASVISASRIEEFCSLVDSQQT